jgi:hypothetical protein
MLEALQRISDAITILSVAAGIVMVLVVFFQAFKGGPGHACDFVGKCNGSNLDRPTVHQTSKLGPLRAVLPRISDCLRT